MIFFLCVLNGDIPYFSFVPATPSSQCRTLEWLFQVTLHPLRALSLVSFIYKIKRYKVCLAPKALCRRPYTNFNCMFVLKPRFFQSSLIVKANRIEMVTRTDASQLKGASVTLPLGTKLQRKYMFSVATSQKPQQWPLLAMSSTGTLTQ